MASERDIQGYIGVLSGALTAPDGDEEAERTGKIALLELVSIMLIDLHRIAEASEIMARDIISKSVNKP